MTSIGTVFVTVAPDTSKFAQKLRAELSRVTEDVKVQISPDLSGFAQKLRADLSRAGTEDVKVKAVPDLNGFAEKLRAELTRAATEDVKVKVIPDTAAFTQRMRADLARASTEDIKVKVVPDTTAFIQRMRADLARASTEEIKVKITPDTTTFAQRLRDDLARASTQDIKVKVSPDTTDFSQKLRAALSAIGVDLKIKVQPDFTGFLDAVRLELRWIEAHEKLTIRVNADSDHLRQEVRDAIARAQAGQRIVIPINAGGGLGGGAGGAAGAAGSGITGILGGLSGVPVAGMIATYAAAGAAVTGLAGAVAALGSALVPVAGLMGSAIPAAAVGMGQAFGAILIPMHGVTGAIKALSTAQQDLAADGKISALNQEKLKEAMERLSPAAQELVRTIFSLRPAWDSLQKATQQALFPGVNDALQQMIKTLPNLQQILVETSGVFGDLARQFGRMFASPLWQRDIQIVGMANATTLANLGTAGLNLLDVFRNLSAAVAPFVLYLSHLVAGLTETWKAQIETARTTGALNAFFRQGYETLLQLGRIAGNTFSGMWNVIKQGMAPGRELLAMIEGWSAKFKEWSRTAQAQTQINDFFRGSVVIFKAASLAIGGVGVALLSAVTALGRFAPQISQVGGVLQKTVTPAFTALSTVARTTLGPALAAVGTVVVRDVAPAFASLVNAVGRGVAPALDGLGRAVRDSVAPALGSMARTVTTVLAPALGGLAQLMGQRLGQIFQEAGKLIRDHVTPAFNSLAKLIRDVAIPVFKAIVDVAGDLAVVFLRVLGPAIDGVKAIFDGLRAVLAPLASIISQHKEVVYLAAAAWAYFNRSMITAATLSLLHGLGSAIGSIRGALSTVPQLLTSFVGGLRALGAGSILLGAGVLGGIALAIVAVANGIDAWANASDRSKAKVQALTDVIKQNPGAIDNYRTALKNLTDASNNLADSRGFNGQFLHDAAVLWKNSVGLITGSTLQAKSDFDQFNRSMEDVQRRFLQFQFNVSSLSKIYFKGNEDAVRSLAERYRIDLSGGLDQARGRFDEMYRALIASAPASASLRDKIGDLAGNIDQARKDTDTFRQSLDLLFGGPQGYQAAAERTSEAIQGIARAAKAAHNSLGTFNGTIWTGTQRQADLRDQITQSVTALQDQSVAYGKNGHSAEESAAWLNTHVAALRQQLIALGLNKGQVDSYLQSLGYAPDKLEAATAATNVSKNSFINQATAAGIGRKALDGYLNGVDLTNSALQTAADNIGAVRANLAGGITGRIVILNNVPEVTKELDALGVKYTVNPLTGKIEVNAEDNTAAAMALIRAAISAPVKIPIVPGWLAGTALGRGIEVIQGAFASGGWVNGPGSATSDSIPAMLSNGEFVVNARAAQQYADLLQQINGMASGTVIRNGILHLAGGGLITATVVTGGLNIAGNLTPITVELKANTADLDRAIANLHPYNVPVKFIPDTAALQRTMAGFSLTNARVNFLVGDWSGIARFLNGLSLTVAKVNFITGDWSGIAGFLRGLSLTIAKVNFVVGDWSGIARFLTGLSLTNAKVNFVVGDWSSIARFLTGLSLTIAKVNFVVGDWGGVAAFLRGLSLTIAKVNFVVGDWSGIARFLTGLSLTIAKVNFTVGDWSGIARFLTGLSLTNAKVNFVLGDWSKVASFMRGLSVFNVKVNFKVADTSGVNGVNGAMNKMAANAEVASNRVIAAMGRQSGSINTLAVNTGTRMGQIIGSETRMAGQTEGSTARVVSAYTRNWNNAAILATLIGTRHNQINVSSSQNATAFETAARRIGTAFGTENRNIDGLTNNFTNRHRQINTSSSNNAGAIEAAARRIGAAFGSQNAGVNNLASNVGTRHKQINTSSGVMAGSTEGATRRVNTAYTGMQRKVDSLHGKNIAVSSTASVRYPPDSAIQGAARRAASILGSAFAGVADGAIFIRADGGISKRARGSIDRLPEQAIISPARGPGIVQWAEAETGGEAFIPLAAAKRKRSLKIWEETGRRLGAMATGGLLNVDTRLDDKLWAPAIQRLQTLSEQQATSLGRVAAEGLGRIAGAGLGRLIASLITAPHGPGASMIGSWAAGIRPWVQYITSKLNISGSTYGGHHPAQSHAVDLALSQDGMKNTAPRTGPTGGDLYSRVARWIDANILAKPTPGWYQGVHAAIHTRGGSWHPASSQVGRRGQTYAHDDHVHLSFDPRYGGPIFGVPGNYSSPGFNWDHGGRAPVVPGAALGFGFGAGGTGGTIGAAAAGLPFSQAQMEQAMRRVGAPANIAHIFSAIGMAENPASRRITNPTGTYDSVWALQEAWTIPQGIDINRLNTDLVYAAGVTYNLYKQAGFRPWEAYTRGSYARFMAEGGILERFMRAKRKKTLVQGDEDWEDQRALYRGVAAPFRRFDAGGYLLPGITTAANKINRPEKFDTGGWLKPGVTVVRNDTGRPERVTSHQQDMEQVMLLRQQNQLLAEQNQLLRRLPNAQADALNSVAYRAMTYR